MEYLQIMETWLKINVIKSELKVTKMANSDITQTHMKPVWNKKNFLATLALYL